MSPKPADQPSPAIAPAKFEERRRVPRGLPAPDVIEGNGGDTDWALWSDATQQQDEADAPWSDTVPMPPDPAETR